MSEHIKVTTSERVTTIRIDRPEKKNALSLAMYGALREALETAAGDPQVRAIALVGSPACFSAGNDIGDFIAATQGAGGDITAPLGFLRALATLDKPLVAGVAGVAIGIGTTMLLHCDLVYAAATARFKTPFVELALVPEAGSSLILPALVGERRAAQLLLLGEQIDAVTAAAWGLVNAVVEDPELAAVAAARQLAQRAPAALRSTKQLTRRPSRAAILETIRVEGEAFAERLRSPEAVVAFQAFLMRKPADFSGFV